MDFGKLPNIDHVDFRLPPEPERNRHTLSAFLDTPPLLHLYIGCTGWHMKSWVGTYYPKGIKPSAYLQHYGRQFNTIEHNTTHYSIPQPETVEQWYRAVPDDFKFCPKIPQVISHSKTMAMEGDLIYRFCDAIGNLNEKLGACFLQLPPYFGPDRWPLLQAFLARFPKSIPLALEFRHPDWFTQAELMERVSAYLCDRQSGLVITDVAGRRDVLHMAISAYFTMIRFVGNDLHPSDFSRLDDWALRIRHWASQGLREAYFFTHEPDNLQAPEAAAYLHRLLQDDPLLMTRGPQKITQQTLF